MSSQKPSVAKKRKSSEVHASETTTTAELTNQPHQSTLPSPSHFYASPQRYTAQFAHHGGYPYGNTQQYPYHPSPPHGYGNVPTMGYPTGAPQHHPIHATAHHHHPPSSNSFVTPETQQTLSAFASPPSSLRRQPLGSTERGATTTGTTSLPSGKKSNRACKFIRFVLILFFRESCLNFKYLYVLCNKLEIWIIVFIYVTAVW